MRKKIIAVLLFLLTLSIVFSVITVYASDSDLYSNLDETAKQSGDDYFVKYRDNYALDTEKMSISDKIVSGPMEMITNGTFSLQKMLAQLTISIFSFSLSTNISLLIGAFLEPFIDAMKSSMWDNFAIYTVAIAALALLIKMAQIEHLRHYQA